VQPSPVLFDPTVINFFADLGYGKEDIARLHAAKSRLSTFDDVPPGGARRNGGRLFFRRLFGISYPP